MKWADYLISRVRFNGAETHIDKVEVRLDNGDSVDLPFVMTRQDVISDIHSRHTFCTVYMRDGKWHKGAIVATEWIDRQEFIKTRPDGTKRDNLDNLPRF